jgi:hypothetical protein
MQTVGDVKKKVASLVGDPDLDWLTDDYFLGFANIAYEGAINSLALTCSPYIEKVVTVPGINVGADENNLGPNAQQAAQLPLKYLKKPRFLQWKQTGAPSSRYREVKEFSILPNGRSQVAPLTVDIEVRGDFMPPPLTQDTDIVQVHPNMGPCLALMIGALIGMERPNQGWVEAYGTEGKDQLGKIEADLSRQQQHLTFRLGSPNHQNRGGGNGWNLSGSMGWEWRSFGLYVKLL